MNYQELKQNIEDLHGWTITKKTPFLIIKNKITAKEGQFGLIIKVNTDTEKLYFENTNGLSVYTTQNVAKILSYIHGYFDKHVGENLGRTILESQIKQLKHRINYLKLTEMSNARWKALINGLNLSISVNNEVIPINDQNINGFTGTEMLLHAQLKMLKSELAETQYQLESLDNNNE